MPHAQIHHLTKFGEDSIQNKEVVSKNVNVDTHTDRHTDRQTDDRHLAWYTISTHGRMASGC